MTAVGTEVATARVSAEQRARYRARGHLVVPQVVPEAFLDAVQRFLEAFVDQRAREWQRAGLLDDTFAGLDFGCRYHRAWLAAGRPRIGAIAHDDAGLVQGLADEIAQGWLVALVAGVLGADDAAVLDSCFYRAKFPGDETTTLPWHQDAQCLEPISGVDFVTAWIPLADVSEATSCLEVAPVAEEQGMFERTWGSRGEYVCMCEADVQRLTDVEAVRMRRGDVLLLSPYAPHRSRDNPGTRTRWSIDLRYRPRAEH